MIAMEPRESRHEGTENDMTIGMLHESIETNLWLADAYFLRGAAGLAVECLRDAWLEYVRFREVLRVYEGSDALGERLRVALVSRAGDAAAELALLADGGALTADLGGRAV
ncbi:MAG: hypothetical protein IT208_04360 [Chthonomonadales bacterium]|nr:hypothetical protein [Chthonomonadales bacterium]